MDMHKNFAEWYRRKCSHNNAALMYRPATDAEKAKCAPKFRKQKLPSVWVHRLAELSEKRASLGLKAFNGKGAIIDANNRRRDAGSAPSRTRPYTTSEQDRRF